MGDQTVLRVFSFRPSGSGSAFDETIRGTILPALLAQTGIVDALVGRRADETAERVVASVWAGHQAMDGIQDEETALVGSHAEGDLLDDPQLDIASLRISVRRDRSESPRIMRVFRGRVLDGRLEEYIARAREGTLAEADSNPGLVALYLGTTGSATFITVSAWTDWSAIEDATGGDIHRPMATKHPELLADAAVSHYELLPNAERPTTSSAARGATTIG